MWQVMSEDLLILLVWNNKNRVEYVEHSGLHKDYVIYLWSFSGSVIYLASLSDVFLWVPHGR